jgi:hypothetical protein
VNLIENTFVELNINSIGLEPDLNEKIMPRVVNLLKIVFYRLNIKGTIYVDPEFPNNVKAESADQERYIKQVVNMAFYAFFEANYDAYQALKNLEAAELVPTRKNLLLPP